MASIRTTTAPIWSTKPSRLADAARVGGFGLAILALEAILAHGVAGPEIARYVFLFVGLFAVAFVFRFPMVAALALLAFTDFVFHPTYFAVSLGSLSIRPQEVALACLFAVAVVRPQQRSWGGWAGAALGVFLGMVVVSALFAVQDGGTSLTEAFNQARALSLLTLFYVVIRLFPTPEQRRVLLTGAAVIAAATGLIAVLVALGAGFGSNLQAPGEQTIKAEGGIGSIQRVRLPGLSAGYGLFWFAVVQIAVRRGARQLGWSLLLAGISLDIAVSFNRNMWLGLAIGAILMAVLGGSLVRNRMAAGVAVAVAGLAVLMVFGSATTSNKVVQPIIKRGATILDPKKTEQESSLQERATETTDAWAVARHHLILGVGAGTPFGVNIREPISTGSFIIGATLVPQLFLHNQYLYLLLIAGIPGLLAFIAFLGIPLAHSIRRVPRDPAIVACGVGIAMIMVSSIVAIYFTVEDMTAVLGLLTGVLVADAQGRAAAGEDSGLLA